MRVLIFLFVLLISTASFSQSSKLKDLEQQRRRALLEIENTDKLLKDTKANTASLLTRIKLISNQITNRQQVVSLLEQEIEELKQEEEKISGEINTLTTELELKKKSYHKAIVSMMRNRESDNQLLFVLSGRSLSESYRRFLYLKDYSNWRKRQADDILKRSKLLTLKQDSLNLAKVEKEKTLETKAIEQKNLKQEEENYQKEVNKAQKNAKDLQRILDQKKRQAQALDKQIEKLIAEEIKRQEEKARKEAKEDKVETATKPDKAAPSAPTEKPTVVSTKENIKLSNNFASNKGKLPYPITGNYFITSKFGPQKHGRWVTTSSGGIDIQSQANAQAKAVFNGVITHISSFPGYGTCIIIRHGNYYTFYGNIQSVVVKKGENVTTGQPLGTVYTDPDTNVSQMHFQLWQSRTKLNPEPWLRR